MALKQETLSASQENNDEQTRRPPRLPLASLILGPLTLIGMLASIWMIFLYAPMDAIEKDAQRIFYIHVPSAWVGMLAFTITAVAGIVYLVKAEEHWDWVARASAEVGTVFLSIALITGSLWGKPIWGTWWTWDPKLTATLILWFMFVAYLMLRSYMGRSHASARSGAVLAIIGVIDVPIIYEATNWWRTLHPTAEIGQQAALPLPVVLTVLVSSVTFTLLYSLIMIQVYQLQKMQSIAQRLRATVE
jgi:heme exporter protein C